jgi:hypothetical protein
MQRRAAMLQHASILGNATARFTTMQLVPCVAASAMPADTELHQVLTGQAVSEDRLSLAAKPYNQQDHLNE